jgi:Fic family protein
VDLRTLIGQVDQLKAKIDALRPIDADQEARVVQMLRIGWNYHSNAIEGNTLTLREHLASYDA